MNINIVVGYTVSWVDEAVTLATQHGVAPFSINMSATAI